MAVSSIKDCWSKFSARLRDVFDVVDSHYTTRGSDLSESRRQHRQQVEKRTGNRAGHGRISSTTNNNIINGNTSGQELGGYSKRASRKSSQQTHHLPDCHHNTSNGGSHHAYEVLAQRPHLPPGFTKKKTTQGQVFFLDSLGQRHWYDPSVPRELLVAQLNLDSLVGRLSSTWEVRHAPSGKAYYVNHIKKTTQFTDPRLVAYRDYLMRILKCSNSISASIDFANIGNNNSSNNHYHPSTTRVPASDRHSTSHSQNNNYPPPAAYPSSNQLSQHRSSVPLSNKTNPVERVIANLISDSATSATAANLLKKSSGNSSTLNGRGHNRVSHHNHSHNHFYNHNSSQHSNHRPGSRTNSNLLSPLQSHRRCESVTNLYNPYSANSNDNHQNLTPLLPNLGHDVKNPSKSSKELTDKISILRQELLKQQVIAHPCRIDVNRKRIFDESYRVLSQLMPRDLKKRLLVKFKGEEGLDYGGVAREWFYLLSREILNPVHGLFQYTSDEVYNLQINPDSGIIYREHLSYYNFCGRVIGMAVFHGHFIEGRFTLPFYKMLLKKTIKLSDIEFVDPELHRSMCWMLENDITDVIDTTFLVQHNAFGQLQEHELKENGRNITVTEDNKEEYVALYVNHKCRLGIESQFEALQRGFHELISPTLLENFDEHELELLIGGLSKIDLDDWQLHTKLKNCNIETPLVKWFWDIVGSYSEDKRASLLQFVTGSPRVPIQGFKALHGLNSELRLFTIHLIRNACTDNLPKSHTCFNRIDLPPYESYEKLRDKLTQAIEETMGFAMQ